MTVLIEISDEMQQAIDNYIALAEQTASAGAMTPIEWENARSYAVDITHELLRGNHQAFLYVQKMRAIAEQRKKAGPR